MINVFIKSSNLWTILFISVDIIYLIGFSFRRIKDRKMIKHRLIKRHWNKSNKSLKHLSEAMMINHQLIEKTKCFNWKSRAQVNSTDIVSMSRFVCRVFLIFFLFPFIYHPKRRICVFFLMSISRLYLPLQKRISNCTNIIIPRRKFYFYYFYEYIYYYMYLTSAAPKIIIIVPLLFWNDVLFK